MGGSPFSKENLATDEVREVGIPNPIFRLVSSAIGNNNPLTRALVFRSRETVHVVVCTCETDLLTF